MSDSDQWEIGEDNSLLLMDDDEPFLRRLARAMEKRGFAVEAVETVAAGKRRSHCIERIRRSFRFPERIPVVTCWRLTPISNSAERNELAGVSSWPMSEKNSALSSLMSLLR